MMAETEKFGGWHKTLGVLAGCVLVGVPGLIFIALAFVVWLPMSVGKHLGRFIHKTIS